MNIFHKKKFIKNWNAWIIWNKVGNNESQNLTKEFEHLALIKEITFMRNTLTPLTFLFVLSLNGYE